MREPLGVRAPRERVRDERQATTYRQPPHQHLHARCLGGSCGGEQRADDERFDQDARGERLELCHVLSFGAVWC